MDGFPKLENFDYNLPEVDKVTVTKNLSISKVCNMTRVTRLRLANCLTMALTLKLNFITEKAPIIALKITSCLKTLCFHLFTFSGNASVSVWNY